MCSGTPAFLFSNAGFLWIHLPIWDTIPDTNASVNNSHLHYHWGCLLPANGTVFYITSETCTNVIGDECDVLKTCSANSPILIGSVLYLRPQQVLAELQVGEECKRKSIGINVFFHTKPMMLNRTFSSSAVLHSWCIWALLWCRLLPRFNWKFACWFASPELIDDGW